MKKEQKLDLIEKEIDKAQIPSEASIPVLSILLVSLIILGGLAKILPIVYDINIVVYVMNWFLEICKVWPLWTVLLFIVIFHKNIAGLIDRIKSLSKNGIDFFDKNQPKKNLLDDIEHLFKSSIKDSRESTQENFQNINKIKVIKNIEKLNIPDECKTVMKETEDKIKNELSKLKYLVRDEKDEKDILIRTLTNINLNFEAERNYNLIFGSQLKALEFLLGVIKTEKINLQKFYEDAKSIKEYSLFYSNYSFNNWFNFLEQLCRFIKSENDKVIITDRGKAFLRYLRNNNLSLNKTF